MAPRRTNTRRPSPGGDSLLQRMKAIFYKSGSASRNRPESPAKPKASMASPWGQRTYLDYNTGGITTREISRDNQQNIPLYYNPQTREMTHEPDEASLPAVYGMKGPMHKNLKLAMKLYRDANREVQLQQDAAKKIADKKAKKVSSTPVSPAQPPYQNYPDYGERVIKKTLDETVEAIKGIYESGEANTPAGQAELTRLFHDYKKYAPPESAQISVHGPDGEEIPIPLPEPERLDPKAHPIVKALKAASAPQRAILDLLGLEEVPSVGDYAERVATELAPYFGSDRWYQDMDAWVEPVRSFFGRVTQAPPVNLLMKGVPVAIDVLTVPAQTMFGSVRMGWSHVQAAAAGDFDLGEIGASFVKFAAQISPPGLVYNMASNIAAIVTGQDYDTMYETAQVFGIPIMEFMDPFKDTEIGERRQQNLNDLREAVRLVWERVEEVDAEYGQIQPDFIVTTFADILNGDRFERIRNEMDARAALDSKYELEQGNLALQLEQLHMSLGLAREVNDAELIENLGGRLEVAANRIWEVQKLRTDVSAHDYRYTWDWSARGTALELAFNEAVVEAIMQKGRQLEPWEIMEISNRFVEFGPEFAGEAIFDPLNLIPGNWLAKVFKGVVGAPGKILRTLSPNAYDGIISFMRTGAVSSVARRFGNSFNDVARHLSEISGTKHYDEFIQNWRRVGGHILGLEGAENIDDLALGRGKINRLREAIVELEIEAIDDLEKFLDSVGRRLRKAGLELTPENFAAEVGEIAARKHMDNASLPFARNLGLLDEGAMSLLMKHVGTPGGASKTLINAAFTMQKGFRKVWIPLILIARPGYTVINHFDNMFRAVVHGVNFMTGFQGIIDDLGQNIPDAVKGGLGRNFSEDAVGTANRIISGDVPASFGAIFADGVARGWKESNLIQKVYRPWITGLANVNAASEFMWRTRLYHKFRLEDMRQLFRLADDWTSIRATELGGLSDEGMLIVKNALVAAGDNPALAAKLIKGEGGRWHKLLPMDQYNTWVQMFGRDGADVLAKRLTTQLQTLIDTGNFTMDNVRLIRDDIIRQVDDHLQEAISEYRHLGAHPERDVIDPPLDAAESMRVADDIVQPQAADTPMSAAEHQAAREAQHAADNAATAPQEVSAVAQADISDELAEGADDFTQQFRRELEHINNELEKVKEQLSPEDYREFKLSIAELQNLQGARLGQASAEFFGKVDSILTNISVQGEAFEGAEQANRAIAHAQMVVNSWDKQVRGPFHNFALHVYPGPRATEFTTAQQWRAWREVTGAAYMSQEAVTRQMSRLIDEGLWDDIMEIKVPTPKQYFEDGLGWEFHFNEETGLLEWFKRPDGGPSHQRGAIKRFFGFMTKGEFESVPFNEIQRRAPFHELDPPIPNSLEDLRQTAIQNLAWETVLDMKYPGTGIGYGPVLRSIFGEAATENPQAFGRAAENHIRRLIQNGHIDVADSLRNTILEIQSAHHQILALEGFAGIAQAPAILPLHKIPDSIATKIQALGHQIAGAHMVRTFMDDWVAFIDEAIQSGSWFTTNINPAERAVLNTIGDEVGQLLADGVDAVDNGGRAFGQSFDGAINQTNNIMINYDEYGQFDRFIKDNIAPFWMFPSRSFPMWIDTLVKKPWLGALYGKYLRASERVAFEKGATTRTGRQLPSKRGYIPVPGTDIWFNPTATMSLRYVFPRINDTYETEVEESPTQRAVNYVMEWSRAFGLHADPWIYLLGYETDVLDANKVPRMSLLPQYKLLPPNWRRSITNWFRNAGALGRMGADIIDPDVSWKDFMIEERILKNALQRLNEGELTEEQSFLLVQQSRDSVSVDLREQDPALMKIWEEARDQIENEEWTRNAIGYFTAFYGKSFTTGDAEMAYLLKNIRNLQLSLNDEARAAVFDFPADVVEREEAYTSLRYDTPEGFLANTRAKISFVRDPLNDDEQAFGARRLEILSNQIAEDQQTEAYFTGIKAENDRFQEEINNLPYGTSEYGEAWERHINLLSYIEKKYPLARRGGGFVGYKPSYVVFEDLQDEVWRAWRSSGPTWRDGEETYGEYQTRREEWLQSLPDVAENIVNGWLNTNFTGPAIRGDEPSIRWMDATLNMPADFRQRLIDDLTPENYELWKKSNDSAWQALDRAWEALMWDPYWEALTGPDGQLLKGDEFRLAEIRFVEGLGPDQRVPDEALIAWVQQEYPDRFDVAELQRKLAEGQVYTIADRQIERMEEEDKLSDNMWDLLARVPPGRAQDKFDEALERAYVELGLDRRDATADVNTWYKTNGNPAAWGDAEDFENFQKAVGLAIEALGYPEPDAQLLEQRINAKRLNEEFVNIVNTKLGEDFYNFQAEYYALSSADRRAFRESFPNEYAKIVAYAELKDAYAKQFPGWAAFYHREVFEALEEGKSLDEALAAIGAGGGFGGGGGRGSGRGGGGRGSAIPPFVRPGLRGAFTGQELLQRGVGKGGITARPFWPQWLLDTLGEPAAKEVEKSASAGQSLSKAIIDYLKNLDANDKRNIESETEKVYNLIRNRSRRDLVRGPRPR